MWRKTGTVLFVAPHRNVNGQILFVLAVLETPISILNTVSSHITAPSDVATNYCSVVMVFSKLY